MTENRNRISRRPMHGLKAETPTWAQLGIPETPALSDILDAMAATGNRRLHLCGSLEQMTREYVQEPLRYRWKFSKAYVHKYRAPVYELPDDPELEISAKLIGHRNGWFPGCEDMETARAAWAVLESEWTSATGLPLLSSPAATGKALLWETLPRDSKTKEPIQFPCLPDDLAKLIRANSPQHRIETLNADNWKLAEADFVRLYQYDGRWMYAAMCGLDRFPVGEPRRVGYFTPYEPGWHHVAVSIPDGWNHIGLLPVLDDRIGWTYPSAPGSIIKTWASEPELTLALANGWKIYQHFDGYAFDKGRPLGMWQSRLIGLRKYFQLKEADYAEEGAFPGAGKWPFKFAAAAVRQILNHTIGAMHVNGYEREKRVSESDWKQWRRDNAAWFDRHDYERADDGAYIVSEIVPSTSPLDIYMPHWSATVYALARARVAQWALKCDGKEGRPGPEALVKINGDAIYSTAELPFADNGNLGQLRRKE